MKAYLINLDSAGDRLAQFDDQARTLGFDYQRISAVDGRTPEFAERLGKPARTRLGEELTPVEVACFESHRAVWRAIVDSGDSHGMALEDDIILKPGFERYVAPGWAPPEADIIRLESWIKPVHLDRAGAHKIHGRGVYRLRSDGVGTGAYVISAACAADLLARSERIEDPIDNFLFFAISPVAQSLKTYQMAPAPARQALLIADYQNQDFAQSDIAPGRGYAARPVDFTHRAPWWRPFKEVPDMPFRDFCAMALWIAKERVKGLMKGTHFKFVTFE